MPEPNDQRLNPLLAALKNEAARTRPDFSPALHDRILAGVTDAQREPAARAEVPPPAHRLGARVCLTVAASLLAVLVTGVVVRSQFERRPAVANQDDLTPGSSDAGQESPEHTELIQLASAAATHLALLDEDVKAAAEWFADELPFDLTATDSAGSESEEAPADQTSG